VHYCILGAFVIDDRRLHLDGLPSCSPRFAVATTAFIQAPRKPAFSSSCKPAIVVPVANNKKIYIHSLIGNCGLNSQLTKERTFSQTHKSYEFLFDQDRDSSSSFTIPFSRVFSASPLRFFEKLSDWFLASLFVDMRLGLRLVYFVLVIYTYKRQEAKPTQKGSID
jgi:hypothetical protein